ncbi:MAG: hypothetical protein RLZ12_238 [Bacillota bacterium]|jgi:hypothetical protein
MYNYNPHLQTLPEIPNSQTQVLLQNIKNLCQNPPRLPVIKLPPNLPLFLSWFNYLSQLITKWESTNYFLKWQ